MKHIRSRWLTSALSMVLAASLLSSGAADKDKDQPRGQQRPNQGGQGQNNPNRNANPRNVEAEQRERQRQEERRREEEQREQRRKQMEQQKAEQERQRQEQKRKEEEQREAKRQKERAEAEEREKQRQEQKRKEEEQRQQEKLGKRPGEDEAKGKDRNVPPGETQATSPQDQSQVNQRPDGPRGRGNAKEEKEAEQRRMDEKRELARRQKEQEEEARKERQSGHRKEDTGTGYQLKDSKGLVRKDVEKNDNGERVRHFNPGGRKQSEEVRRKDGTIQKTEYDLGGKEKQTVVKSDGSKEVTTHQPGRDNAFKKETVQYNSNNKIVSKVVVKNVTVNKTVVNVSHHYDRGRYGYVYRPVIVRPVVFDAYYDPFWHGPVRHHFTYSWHWHAEPWYVHHAYYWRPYPVYVAPSYWVTDWLVAGYIADRYALAASVEQSRLEVEQARKEAAAARNAAEEAKDAAERAAAQTEKANLEAALARAEAKLAKVEAAEAKRKERGDNPPPNAKPIDEETKNALNKQVEKTIKETKDFADTSAKNTNAAPPDVAQSLKDPDHIYPVSKNVTVRRAKDGEPAGTLSPGDLLKVEPGQETALSKLGENTELKMRVITSKGEDDSVPAGTLVLVPLSELQEFDSEFRAKIDDGLAEAEKNNTEFKKNVAKN